MKLSIVIPAYNEASTLGKVLQEVISLNLPNIEKEIIVVDDGSSDATTAVAKEKNVVVVRHLINRGLGAALGTGISLALKRGADIVLTFDGDGQHAPEDIPRVILPLQMNQADAVIGSRMLGGVRISRSAASGTELTSLGRAREPRSARGTKGALGMPWIRRMANRTANILTWILFGIRTTDSQSGLRAFSRYGAQKIKISFNNYEVSSEICGEIGRNNLRFVEVPIASIYTEYSLSKGQSFVMGLKTLFRMVLHAIGRQG